MIKIIAAYSRNRVIGKSGRIPWDLPDDRHRFKALTTGNVVVMGRNTYEEIGKPLPGRVNVVISSTDRKSTRLNSSHRSLSRMPSSA